MKRLVIWGLALLGVAGSLLAQEPGSGSLRLIATGGGRIGGSLSGYGNDLSINESAVFGGRVGVRLDEERWIEFLYSQQDSEVRGRYAGEDLGTMDIGVAYYQINVVQEVHQKGVDSAAVPYLTGGLGVATFSSSDATVSSETSFAMNGGGGVDIPIGQRLGLLLEARLYVTIATDSTFIAYGSSGGTLGVSGSSLFQAEANAGVYLQF